MHYKSGRYSYRTSSLPVVSEGNHMGIACRAHVSLSATEGLSLSCLYTVSHVGSDQTVLNENTHKKRSSEDLIKDSVMMCSWKRMRLLCFSASWTFLLLTQSGLASGETHIVYYSICNKLSLFKTRQTLTWSNLIWSDLIYEFKNHLKGVQTAVKRRALISVQEENTSPTGFV